MINVLILSAAIVAINAGMPCTTPLGEKAKCIPIKSCGIIIDAMLSRNKTLLDTVKTFKCKQEGGEAITVCCGTRLLDTSEQLTIFENLHSEIPCYEKVINPLLPSLEECGKHEYRENILDENDNVRIWEFPWISLLQYSDKYGRNVGFKCGGTLINHRYVLTAAHCLRGKYQSDFNISFVRLGENAIDSPEDCFEEHDYNICVEPDDMEIEETIVHPHYNSTTRNNDIALLRLKKDVVFNDYVKPICLPNEKVSQPTIDTKMYVSGWGTTIQGRSTNIKHKSAVATIEKDDCREKFQNSLTQVTSKQICAEGAKGKNCCQGDSGGPLMNRFVNNSTEGTFLHWYQEGIISTGIGCGTAEYPGIFTKVSKYLNWIAKNMRE